MEQKHRGRPPGTRNQNVINARRAIADFVESNLPRFNGWLDQIANGIPAKTKAGQKVFDSNGCPVWLVKPDPLAALKIVAEVTEYHLPKLSRQDVQLTGVIANLDVEGLTAADLAQMSLSDLKRLALDRFSQAAQRGDAIDLGAIDVEAEVVESLPSWLDPST